jgi:zinc/manganese transport system substrate-binding protein
MAMMRNKVQNKSRKWIIVLVVVVIVAGAGLALINVGGIVTNARKIHVVAAENFWGNIASQIGGNQVTVTSIISNPNVDPHLYESDARDAIDVATAGVVIENGLGYDDFMDKLIAASGSSSREVLTASRILGVTGEDANPHLWYNVPQVPLVAARIAEAYETKDPGSRAQFERNLATFDKSLQPILDATSQIKQQYAGEPVAYTERVPGYLLDNTGLRNETPSGFASAVEDGVDPSPSATYEMDSLLEDRRVRVLLYNAQTVSLVTEQVRHLAEENHIPVVAVTETMPTGASYQSWQLDQIKALENALGGK